MYPNRTMKLPKNFGGGGFQGMMAQMQQAMAQAQTLEEELKRTALPVKNGPIEALFDGTGEIQQLKIVDPSIVDPDDVEGLEDLIVATIRAGFAAATELREGKVKGILPNVPDLPGL